MDKPLQSLHLEAMQRGLPELGATPLEILRFLAAGTSVGQRGALVTMTARDGSSVRSLGSHMAVLADGSFAGSFSGGCIEAAIVAEAQEAIRDGRSRRTRYGKGSKFIDIRLPCGGGIDLLFSPDPPAETIARAVALLEARQPVTMALGHDGMPEVRQAWHDVAAQWSDGRFLVRHAPPLRLVVAGQGGESLALVRIGRAYGAEVALLSPDEAIVAAGAGTLLRSLAAPPAIETDPWTAVALLFHDHAWEVALLKVALDTDAFWIGAMGSERTHATRLETLAGEGVLASALARVHGPIGLIPATRDPATLALSALAEIAGVYQRIIR